MRWIKRILVFLAVTFALFYLITRPEDAAGAVKGAFVAVGDAFSAIITFFTSLAR